MFEKRIFFLKIFQRNGISYKIKKQKRENDVLVSCIYGRFLTITTVAIAIATIMAMVEIAKYISVGG